MLSERDAFPSLLAEIARRPLRELARSTRAHAHLAILEGDMVTYLVKEPQRSDLVHSREKMQLEAYCTALGKMLLAHIEPAALDDYLAAEFVRLTAHTVTDPEQIKGNVTDARTRGWATEIEETAPNLMCLAVPIADRAGRVLAAISVSVVGPHPDRALLLERLPLLQQTGAMIEDKLFPR
jgi:DNA-binding IclR family transcriptional regulator